MAIPQDLVGTVIKHVPDPGGASQPEADRMEDGVAKRYVTPVAAQVYTMTGNLGGPQGRQFSFANRTWSFDYLKYVVGFTTVAPLLRPILTGNMSGCYLFKYTEDNQQHIAHVGTADVESDPRTAAAKAAWKAFALRPQVSNISGGDPFNNFSTNELVTLTSQSDSRKINVLGYFDGTGNAFSIAYSRVASQAQNQYLPMVRIHAVKSLPLQPWATVSGLPKFA